MTIRWRLVVLVLQLVVLGIGTQVATGDFLSSSGWFLVGILAVVLNQQLIEPFFPRPADALANSIVGLALYALADKPSGTIGWHAVAVVLGLTLLVSILAMVLGAGRAGSSTAIRIGRAARIVSRRSSARFIYSLVFLVSLLDEFPPPTDAFWTLSVTLVVILILGTVDWRDAWAAATGGPIHTEVEGLVGPSRLLVSGHALPDAGAAVRLAAGEVETSGVVVTRILRTGDSWAEVHLDDSSTAARLLASRSLELTPQADSDTEIVGSVEEGSTHVRLAFTSSAALEIGTTVAVQSTDDDVGPVLYQLSHAEVRESKVKGGSHLVVEASADQIGRFDPSANRLVLHRWVPEPGRSVVRYSGYAGTFTDPPNSLLVGHVLGTDLPVFLDLPELCDGHVAILGMTKMGKTSLALRLANALASDRRVVMVDQTGEYTDKRGLPPYDETAADTSVGFSVLDLPDNRVGPDFALAFINKIAEKAGSEYSTGDPHPRTVMFDEAHQFVPEPAGMGFGSPGRDAAYQLGIQFMQLRKYGVSLALISQRTAVVAKSALSQCENIIAFRSVDRTGLEYLEQIAGTRVARLLPTLRQGEAVAFGPAVSSDGPVLVDVLELDIDPPTEAEPPPEEFGVADWGTEG